MTRRVVASSIRFRGAPTQCGHKFFTWQLLAFGEDIDPWPDLMCAVFIVAIVCQLQVVAHMCHGQASPRLGVGKALSGELETTLMC